MYSKDYALFVVKQLDDDHQEVANMIIDLVPPKGIINITHIEISKILGIPEAKISKTIEIMQRNKIPILKSKGDKHIFDYHIKEVEYVEHLKRALSNIGMLEDDFF